MTFVDKDLDKVFTIQNEINLLKGYYQFIKDINYISDSGEVGLKIYDKRMVYILHFSVLKNVLNGYNWEGTFDILKNDLRILDSLYDKYSNIELILPTKPSYAIIKYKDHEFVIEKNLHKYKHEDFTKRSLIDKIKYYIQYIINRYFCNCCSYDYSFLKEY